MSLKRKSTSLADKINSLVTAAPTNFNSDDEFEDTKAKVVDFYEDDDELEVQTSGSKIRKDNVTLLDEEDERYKGKKVSRKDVYDSPGGSDSEEEDMSSGIHSESEDEHGSKPSENGTEEEENDSNEDEQVSDENEEDSGESEGESDVENPLRRERNVNFKTMSSTNIRGEVEKGICVRNQLNVWENLLEVRIQLQKCLVASNKMPQYNYQQDLRKDPEFVKSSSECEVKLKDLLDKLLELQENLLKKFPETKSLLTSKKDSRETVEQENGEDEDEEIPSDTEDEEQDVIEHAEDEEEKEEEEEKLKKPPRKKRKLNDYEKILSQRHESYRDYRNSVIQKWNDKTRLASGNITKTANQPVLKQIEFALSDRAKLIKRTQLKRSEYEIPGKVSQAEDADGRRLQEYDPEIFDDDDFYHQLLRDLIEFKSSDITDPVQLSKQWIQLQNMRSKLKRSIDTRATKGRRIRYNVHNKLVNFMAPITVNDTWTDLAKNELYSSLFGKIKAVESNENEVKS